MKLTRCDCFPISRQYGVPGLEAVAVAVDASCSDACSYRAWLCTADSAGELRSKEALW